MEAQNIKVESFSRLENDITARVNIVRDANDDECALIKMVTTDAGYNLDEELKRESRVGEIWFYVPQGTKRIVIRHQKLGKLVYVLPEMLKSKTTYQIKLPDNIEIIVHEDAGGQYLVMNVQPSDALIYIDGLPEVLNNGILQKMLKYGHHTYRVEASLYLPAEGNVLIGKERKNLTVNLTPDFGFIRFESMPEAGASVYVDGRLIGKTPVTTGKLAKGKHSVKAILPMYTPVDKDVMVEAGETSELIFNMSANFAQITLSTSDGEIWVNGERKGINNWTGRLMAGFYKLETRKLGCRPFVTSVELAVGEKRTLTLLPPVPMTGTLNITSNPHDADIQIDGKVVGHTPDIINGVLVGERMIMISKKGYTTFEQKVIITEGKIKELDINLSQEKKKSVVREKPLESIESNEPSDMLNNAYRSYNGIETSKNIRKALDLALKAHRSLKLSSFSQVKDEYGYKFGSYIYSFPIKKVCFNDRWGVLISDNGHTWDVLIPCLFKENEIKFRASNNMERDGISGVYTFRAGKYSTKVHFDRQTKKCHVLQVCEIK